MDGKSDDPVHVLLTDLDGIARTGIPVILLGHTEKLCGNFRVEDVRHVVKLAQALDAGPAHFLQGLDGPQSRDLADRAALGRGTHDDDLNGGGADRTVHLAQPHRRHGPGQCRDAPAGVGFVRTDVRCFQRIDDASYDRPHVSAPPFSRHSPQQYTGPLPSRTISLRRTRYALSSTQIVSPAAASGSRGPM